MIPAERLPGLRRVPPLMRRVQPDVVLYNAWWGKLADSPRAVFEELRRRDAPLEHVWVLNDPATAPDGASAVVPGSLRFLETTGRARYIVSNSTLRRYFRKKPGTTYLQTWHGAVLKRIGFDVERPAWEDSHRYLRALRREVAVWDYLVAPNRFSTSIMRRAFGYTGEVLETGYPRNDVLHGPDRDALRDRARARLDIDPGTTAVLYAPTWRDDDSFTTELDLGALCDGLGDRYLVLLRAHAAVAETVSLRERPGLRNVSAVDDIRELLLAADVLVTDYSSVMFDFAPMGKPIVLFTYDLERYRDELRGFYFDLAAEAPGPLIATTTELVDALRDLDALEQRSSGAHRRFVERYCDLDDGHAAERVVDAVFGA